MRFQGFAEWAQARRGVKLEAEQQQRVIVEADTAFQEASAARGGTYSSALTDEAEEASALIARKRDARLEEVDRAWVPKANKAYQEGLEDLLEAAESFRGKYTAVFGFESERESFTVLEGLPARTRVTYPDLGLHLNELVRRVTATLHPAAPRTATPRPPLVRPDFRAILSRVLGRK